MKKVIKIFLIIFIVLVIIVLVDTIQAKVFDNNALIKIRYNSDRGNVDYVDKGIFVYTYVFTNGEKVTVFRWEKYAPPEEPVDLQTDDISLIYYEIRPFNDKFLEYEGEEVRGSRVRSLISEVITSNAALEQQVSMTFNGDKYDGYEFINKLKNNHKYNVKCEIGENGLVYNINISENKE